MTEQQDSPSYIKKKAFYDSLITLYGRKPVLEALADNSLNIHRLHLASSNKGGGIISQLQQLAERRGVEVVFHNRAELSRISRNAKQDQGVACDIICPGYADWQQLLGRSKCALIALDGVTNPQNLGMIIRSVTASPMCGLLLPRKGSADLSPLVIKASAGTLFKSSIYRCERLLPALDKLRDNGFSIVTLSSHQATDIRHWQPPEKVIYVMGNESDGVSKEVAQLSDQRLCIPMNNAVESLNVAVTAALIAFRSVNY